MKIISCYVENFGVICKQKFTFSDGLTCTVRENGGGKTTLASFIKAMFYGLPTVRSNSKSFDLRTRFYPFDGGRFGGNLIFEYGGDTYRIERFFDKKSDTRDELTVYKNGKVTGGFSCDLGREFFGLDEDSFTRTVFVTAEDTQSFAGGDINNKLNAKVRSTGDYTAACEMLESYKKRLKAARGGGGLIDRKRDERQRIFNRVASLKEIQNNLSSLYEERGTLEKEIENTEGLNEEQSAEKKELKLNIRLLEIEREFPSGLPAKSEIDRLEYLTQNPQKTPNTPAYVPTNRYLPVIILSVIAVLAGIITLVITHYAVGAALLILGVAGIAVYLILKRKKGTVNPEKDNELDSLVSRYKLDLSGDISGVIEKLRQKRSVYDGLLTEISGVRSGQLSGARDYKSELLSLRRRLSVVDAQIASDEAELETLPDALNKLETADGEIAALNQRLETVTHTLNYLTEADGRLKEKYIAPVYGRFSYYAGKIFTALGEKFIMNEDYSISIERGGEIKSGRHLSAGQRQVAGLCIRLALIDNMFAAEKPFVILDDPFICLDGENMLQCAKVLKELAKDTQVIYFTCHCSRGL